MSSDVPFILGFSAFSGIGPVYFKRLLDYFDTVEQAWNGSQKELRAVGIPTSTCSAFLTFKKTFSIEGYMMQLVKKGVKTLTIFDADYPDRLREISDAPFVLYIVGDAPNTLLSEHMSIGVVGTRQITPYGKEVTKRIVRGLVDYGCIIISGLAIGVDTIAHEETLRNSGKTIAVLGCGVNIIAPSQNASLYYKIQRCGGLIVSEMPLSHMPDRKTFPARNRIISGLSRGVVVTEGTDRSGSLITARNAAEQGREVFAVPGPITSIYSRGPITLIKQGALPVECADDILNELPFYQEGSKTI